jgi:hypothetical protein
MGAFLYERVRDAQFGLTAANPGKLTVTTLAEHSWYWPAVLVGVE